LVKLLAGGIPPIAPLFIRVFGQAFDRKWRKMFDFWLSFWPSEALRSIAEDGEKA
jgi:hypothetical protein